VWLHETIFVWCRGTSFDQRLGNYKYAKNNIINDFESNLIARADDFALALALVLAALALVLLLTFV
jgi:hypothetical protein